MFIGQLLLQAQQLVALNRPPERDQYSVRSYIEKNACFVATEKRFAYEKEDLVTLRPGRDHSFVDGFVERMLKALPCRPLKARNFQHFSIFFTTGAIELMFMQYIFCSRVSISYLLSRIPHQLFQTWS